jgi:DNA repair protein RadC
VRPARVSARVSSQRRGFAAAEVLHIGDLEGGTRGRQPPPALEYFVVFDLDVRHRVIARRVVSIGTLSGVEVHPREVFKDAIANSAAAIILAHNHPSGDPTPSREDLALTARLREAGELLGIKVLDHVVLAAAGFISLADRGWM